MDYEKLVTHIMENVTLTFRGNSEGSDFKVSATVDIDEAVLNHMSTEELEGFVIGVLQGFSWAGSGSGWADHGKVYVNLYGWAEGRLSAA